MKGDLVKKNLFVVVILLWVTTLQAQEETSVKTDSTSPETSVSSPSPSAETVPAKKPSLEQQYSGQGYGMAGCGLGSIIFGQNPGKVQIIASTTNGTWYNQSFALSSGTSNCQDDAGNKTASLNVYIEANKLALAKDVSRGGGETVEGLSEILGCQNSRLLGVKLQKKYKILFPSQNVESVRVSASILKSVAEDKKLSLTCHS